MAPKGWELTFHGGHRTDCDILIGADGARSVVRSQLTDVQMSYVATLVELGISDVISLRADDRPIDTYRSKRTLLDMFSGWDPRLTALIEAGDSAPTPRPIEAMPIGTRWASRPGVTLIGDAAHLMPPVGEGANPGRKAGPPSPAM